MGDPNTLTGRLAPDAATWLEQTIRRNRETFGGWKMEADPAPAPDPSPTPPADPPPTPGEPTKTPPWGDPENFNAEKAWELIQNLRNEKGDPAKVAELEGKVTELQTAQQAQLDAIAKALGLKSDDAPPDPDALAAQVQAEQAKAREAAVQLAVYRNAATHEANPDALLDSASFLATLADVDPTDATAVGNAIKAALEKNPALKATPPAPPFPGGPRKPAGKPEPGPGLPRLRDAYAQSSK